MESCLQKLLSGGHEALELSSLTLEGKEPPSPRVLVFLPFSKGTWASCVIEIEKNSEPKEAQA